MGLQKMTEHWSKQYRVATGGLMRCCLETIQNIVERETEPEEGEVFDCVHEKPGNQQIVVENKTFRWNHD